MTMTDNQTGPTVDDAAVKELAKQRKREATDAAKAAKAAKAGQAAAPDTSQSAKIEAAIAAGAAANLETERRAAAKAERDRLEMERKRKFALAREAFAAKRESESRSAADRAGEGGSAKPARREPSRIREYEDDTAPVAPTAVAPTPVAPTPAAPAPVADTAPAPVEDHAENPAEDAVVDAPAVTVTPPSARASRSETPAAPRPTPVAAPVAAPRAARRRGGPVAMTVTSFLVPVCLVASTWLALAALMVAVDAGPGGVFGFFAGSAHVLVLGIGSTAVSLKTFILWAVGSMIWLVAGFLGQSALRRYLGAV